jgi:hypothetical protein
LTPAPTNDVLETAFQLSTKKGTRISGDEVQNLAQKLGMSTRQVERWLRKRKLQERPTTLEKFSETG